MHAWTRRYFLVPLLTHCTASHAPPPGWAIDSTGHTALNPEAVLKNGALMNLGGAREHSGHKG